MNTLPPRPQPPLPPDDAQCCKSGCNPCIWDLYDEEMAAYRAALAEWEARYGREAGAKTPPPPSAT
jgi:hypothetical protein